MSNVPQEPIYSHHPPVPGMAPAVLQYLHWLFGYHVLTIKQKVLTLSQKYHVFDEQGLPRFYVVRPPRIALNVIAGVAGLLANLIFLILAIRQFMYAGNFAYALGLLIVGGYLSGIIRVLLAPFRDISVFTDESEQFPVLMVTQDNKIGLYYWFTIYDSSGQPVARAKRNLVSGMWRKTWTAETLDGRRICRMREDSLFLALLRRYLGPILGFLRTNFDVELPDGRRIGEYNRKLTLTDQYFLDLRGDPYYLIDRRVTLAMAILLDTGEAR